MSPVPPPPSSSPAQQTAQIIYKDIGDAILSCFKGASSQIHSEQKSSAFLASLSFPREKFELAAFNKMFLDSIGIQEGNTRASLLEKPLTGSYYQHSVDPYTGTFSGMSAFLRNLIGYFYPTSQSVAVAFAGETTPMNILSGVCFAQIANQEFSQADREKIFVDKEGKRQAQINYWRGVLQFNIGLSMFVERPTSGYCLLENINKTTQATTSVGLTAFYSSLIGNGLTSLCFLLLAVAQLSPLYNLIRVSKNIGAGIFSLYPKTPDQVMEFFKKELSFSNEGQVTLEKFKEKYKDSAKQKEVLEKEMKEFIRFFIERVYSDLTGKKAEDLEKGVSLMLNSLTLSEEQKSFINKELSTIGTEGFTPSELVGLYIAHKKRLQQARSSLESVIGSHALQLVEQCLQDPSKDKTQALQVVYKAIGNNAFFYSVLFLSAIVGSVAMGCVTVASYVVCAPFMLANTIMVGFAMGIFTIMNLQELHEGWGKESPVSSFERLATYGGVLVPIACLVGIIIFSASTMGTGPVIISMIIVIVWIAMSGLYSRNVYLKNEAYQETHCTMEDLRNRVCVLKDKVKGATKEDAKLIKEAKKISAIVHKKLHIAHLHDKQKRVKFFQTHQITDETRFDAYIEQLQVWEEEENAVRDAVKVFCTEQLELKQAKTLFDKLSEAMPVPQIVKNIWKAKPVKK